MVKIRNLLDDEIEIELGNGHAIVCPALGLVEVPDEIAHGVPASGDDPMADDFDAGRSGLLDQTARWALVKKTKTTADTAAKEG